MLECPLPLSPGRGTEAHLGLGEVSVSEWEGGVPSPPTPPPLLAQDEVALGG